MARFQLAEKKDIGELADMVADLKPKELMSKKARVIAVFDRSPSMEFTHRQFYTHGLMDGIARRALAFALEFDNDGTVPVYWMNDTCQKARNDITRKNLDTWMRDNFSGVSGGTDYSPTLDQILKDETTPGDMLYLLWFIDGETGNEARFTELIQITSHLPIFNQFIGIYGSEREPAFGLLEMLDDMKTGRKLDNVDLTKIGLHTATDEQLFTDLMKEFKKYPALAAQNGLGTWQRHMNYAYAREEHRKLQQQPRRGWFR